MSVADLMISAARECIGTPFRHQGRLLGIGMDCAGVVVYAVTATGHNVLEMQGYGRTPNNGLLRRMLEQQTFMDCVEGRQPGDILLMKFVNEPQHLSIFTGDTIIHAYEDIGRCCEHPLDDRWYARIVSIYRVRDVA